MTDVYTAVVVQPEVGVCASVDDVRRNLARIVSIIGSSEIARRGVFNVSTRPESWEAEPWAPVRLVAFPELSLNLPASFFGKTQCRDLVEKVCIEIPGPETEALGAVCRDRGFWLVCGAYERVAEIPGTAFNCTFLVSPEGVVIAKAHKVNPYIPVEQCATSPHDVLERYLEVFGAPGKSALETLFPVARTEIGNIGMLTCNDGLYPENWRALCLNGAEVIVHGNLPEPFASPPHDWRLSFARSSAVANMCYVVSPSYGTKLGDGVIKFATGGANGSFVVDPEGVVLSQVPYPGEAITSAVIRLDHLRRRRYDPGAVNFISHLRSDLYRTMYDRQIYPRDLLAGEPVAGHADRARRDVAALGVLETLTQRGVLTAPDVRAAPSAHLADAVRLEEPQKEEVGSGEYHES